MTKTESFVSQFHLSFPHVHASDSISFMLASIRRDKHTLWANFSKEAFRQHFQNMHLLSILQSVHIILEEWILLWVPAFNHSHPWCYQVQMEDMDMAANKSKENIYFTMNCRQIKGWQMNHNIISLEKFKHKKNCKLHSLACKTLLWVLNKEKY